MRTHTRKQFASFFQYLISIATVILTVLISDNKPLIEIYNKNKNSPLFTWIAILLIAQTGVLIYGLTIKDKQIRAQIPLMDDIAKLVYDLITKKDETTQYRILVLIHYKNNWWRKILLFFTALFFGNIFKIKGEYYKDRFITVAGYNHTSTVTDGIPFDSISITGQAFFSSNCQCNDASDLLGSSNEQLKSVLSAPITWDGVCIGTLNIDSTKTIEQEETFCIIENKKRVETFAKVIADIIDDDVSAYMPYISSRY